MCPGVRVLILPVFLAGCASTDVIPTSRKQPGVDLALRKQIELGVGYLKKGDYRRAKDKLDRALEIDPGSGEAHTTLGLLFQLEGEYELAEHYFKAALSHEPGLTRARNNYAAFLFSRQRYEEAVDQLTTASEDRFYVNRVAVFENLGVAYRHLGDTTGAEQAFLKATRLDPKQPRALLELAEIRSGQGNHVEARDLYRRHLEVARHSSKSLWLCIRLSRVFRDKDEEASCGLALENIHPASPEYKEYKNTKSNGRHGDVEDG